MKWRNKKENLNLNSPGISSIWRAGAISNVGRCCHAGVTTLTNWNQKRRHKFSQVSSFSKYLQPAGSLYWLLVNSLRPWSASRLCLMILLLTTLVNQGLCWGGLSTWRMCRSKGVTSSSIRTRYWSSKPRYPPIDEATHNKPQNKNMYLKSKKSKAREVDKRKRKRHSTSSFKYLKESHKHKHFCKLHSFWYWIA